MRHLTDQQHATGGPLSQYQATAPFMIIRGSGQIAPESKHPVATAFCGYCDEAIADSRYRDGVQRLCRPCGAIARMSRGQRTEQLRHQLTGDLLRRVALSPSETTHGDLATVFGEHPGTIAGAIVAGVPTNALIFTVLRARKRVPRIAEEIARRGAAYMLAEQAGWTEGADLSAYTQAMVCLALEQDDTLTAAQLAHVAESRFRSAVVPRVAEPDDAVVASLVAQLPRWDAYLLAEAGTAPVSLLTALAEKGPAAAAAVARDPRATAETLAAITAHHEDLDWWRTAALTLQHAAVDVTLLPVPLLAWGAESRGRMIGYLDARLGPGTPARTTAAHLSKSFAGTLAELLLVVAATHQPAGG